MSYLKKILQVVLPLALAAFLFWWVYKDMDFERLKLVLREGLRYEWLLLSIVFSTLSMVIRGLRWQQLLEPVANGARKKTAILAIFVSYAANLIFPRAGEVARCGIVKKSNGASFSKALGTVITERVFDVIFLGVIALAAIVSQLPFFRLFLENNPDALTRFQRILSSKTVWVGLGSVLLLLIFLRYYLKKFSFYSRLRDFLMKLWDGMRSITTLKHPVLFLVYSAGIWFLYFLMFYIGKYFFSFEVNLGVWALLTGFVMGSFGVVAPVQGGIGAYHFMVIYTLVFFGMGESDAGIFALVLHGLQTILSLISGLIAYIWLYFDEKSVK